ncbi:hypothetical protein Clacol_008346 [Clathrus columnatus]|uniref:Uncharacterized protein n=1 Tax=Clathrus columnatus TaxID=1419009 RepID=A0AAV5ALT9_9AGAM|nr:hypothetical protein Clacol_008346 [Clathrus columnatus]
MHFLSGLVFLPLVLKTVASSPNLQSRQGAVAFFQPSLNGGSQLDNAGDGFGEPLNVIISALSSPGVLTDAGILNWARSVNFSTECLDQHLGGPQTANLGDGNGFTNQTAEIREDFGNALLGTCLESLIGGNHFRYWRQNGPEANTGALFLARPNLNHTPEEAYPKRKKNLSENHTIAPNGYDVGRDALVASATSAPTSFGGVTYTATSETITGLLPVGSQGVNHGIALDGIVKLLTITIQ